MRQLLEHIHRVAEPDAENQDDGDLLSRFVRERDETAFMAIVRRHGPLVLGVCRRWLLNPADADDAFQAVFLVLARRAQDIARPGQLSQWLYGTAIRTAKHLREQLIRQRRRVRPVAELPPLPVNHPWPEPELGRLLDDELHRLHEKLRLPVILCLMQGMPRREAAQRLKIPEGTLSTRLAQARTMLRRRLLQRGIVPALAAALVAGRAEAVSPALIRQTVDSALRFAMATSTTAAAAVRLAQGVLRMFAIQRISTAAAVLVAVVLLGMGVSLAVSRCANVATAADPPSVSEVHSTTRKANAGELLLVLHPTPDKSQMGHVVIVEEQDQFVAHSLRGLRKFLTRLRAAEKTPPTTITLVAPAEAKASAVADVVGVCRDAGFTRIVMQNEEPKAQAANRAELLRRLSLDLSGTPPTAAELKRWLKDSSSDAYAKLIDEMLQRAEMNEVWRKWFQGSRIKEHEVADDFAKMIEKMFQEIGEIEKKSGAKKESFSSLHALLEAQRKKLEDLRQSIRTEESRQHYLEALRLATVREADADRKSKDAVDRGLKFLGTMQAAARLQGAWQPKTVYLDGELVKDGKLIERFRWLIIEDRLISFADGKPVLGRIVADKSGPGSLEVVFAAETPDAPRFTGKYTLKDGELTVEMTDSKNVRTGRPANMKIIFSQTEPKKAAP